MFGIILWINYVTFKKGKGGCMNGFVKNVSYEWSYAMKRAVKPGGEIPLDELFEQYGKKYNMTPDDSFVKWLQNVKLKGSNNWKIIFSLDNGENLGGGDEASKVSNVSMAVPMVAKSMKVEDVVTLTVRKARVVLPKITDLNLLKYALNEVSQLSNKDNLYRMLQKRISELQISR